MEHTSWYIGDADEDSRGSGERNNGKRGRKKGRVVIGERHYVQVYVG